MDSKNSSVVPPGKENQVTCRTTQNLEILGVLLSVNRHRVAFEVYAPFAVILMSEVLSDFKIILAGRLIYSGKAVVVNLVHGGSLLVCEAALDEQWVGLEPLRRVSEYPFGAAFSRFLEHWHATYQVLPQFKVAVADMTSLFADLRLWMESLELDIHSSAGTNAAEVERRAAQELSQPVLASIDAIGDRFEEIAHGLPQEKRATHIQLTRRYLHPYLLCSPFAYRTFHKPLGYPGDYGMVNMIVGDPYQGNSL